MKFYKSSNVSFRVPKLKLIMLISPVSSFLHSKVDNCFLRKVGTFFREKKYNYFNTTKKIIDFCPNKFFTAMLLVVFYAEPIANL